MISVIIILMTDFTDPSGPVYRGVIILEVNTPIRILYKCFSTVGEMTHYLIWIGNNIF